VEQLVTANYLKDQCERLSVPKRQRQTASTASSPARSLNSRNSNTNLNNYFTTAGASTTMNTPSHK